MISHNLGPYKILEQLGAGAMGEVYLAEDTRLGRKVAIKVLPTDLAGQPERLERFEREAKAAAALNHPNIAAVFDIGFERLDDAPSAAEGPQPDEDATTGLHFIVQEYLLGTDLRHWLEARRRTLQEKLRVATEIADGLSAAHDAGIVHRDLKPDNVFVTDRGHAKILDFGLAKLIGEEPNGRARDGSSTTAADSIVGRVVGTPGYMSPEQVNGEPSDFRADIFAFGAMLYEMATGNRAFAGRSAAECLSRIVHDEPQAMEDVDDELPLELCRIVCKCLQKDPQRRYQGAADLVVDLRVLLGAVEAGTAPSLRRGSGSSGKATTRAGSSFGTLGIPAIVVTTLLAAVITWMSISRPASPAGPVLRFSVSLPEGIEITRTERPVVAMSRDGQTIAVAADSALWVRELSGDAFVRVAGSQPTSSGGYAVAPSFSPDGDEIAFFVDGAIRSVPLSGGPPISLSPAHIPSSIHWATDGYVYYTQGEEGGGEMFGHEDIWRVPEDGGRAEAVVEVADDRRAAAPQLLPGGEWLLFCTTSAVDFVMNQSSLEEVAVQSLRTGERRRLLTGGFAARYVDTGHILFLEETSLWAVPFNLDGLRTDGGATQVLDSVPMSYWAGTPYMGIADSGNLAVPELALLRQRNGDVSWVNRDGTVEPLDVPMADNPRVSSDGSKIAVEVRDVDDTHIWVHEIDRDTWTELTANSSATAPVWSPDGRWLYYMSGDPGGGSAVWRKSADFTRPADLLWRSEGHLPYPESVPDDGRFLLYSAALGDQNDIWLLWLGDDRGAIPLTATPDISEEGPQVHPSGRFVAYTSRESERYKVYVQELSEDGVMGRRYTISDFGGSEPMWSRDGRSLYYRVGAQLIVVDVQVEPEFRSTDPHVLIREFPGDPPVLRADYDVAPDGRFITAIPQSEWNMQRLDVVVNWFVDSGLRR